MTDEEQIALRLAHFCIIILCDAILCSRFSVQLNYQKVYVSSSQRFRGCIGHSTDKEKKLELRSSIIGPIIIKKVKLLA